MPAIVTFSRSAAVFDAADRLYDEVATCLAELLPGAEIHHVGSTAIRGSLTKGDLDILVRIEGIDFAKADEILADSFARNKGSSRGTDFSAFEDLGSNPHMGIQLVAKGSEFDSFLEWRHRLERDPALREQYDDLKRRYDGLSMAEYRAAKSDFINNHLVD